MVDKDAVRRGYDDIADIYAADRIEDGRDFEILTEFLTSLTEAERTLDVGCGQGTPVLRKLSSIATAIGYDFSRKQLELAGENVPVAPLVQGDMTTLPICDDAFDAIVAYYSLIHVPIEDHQSVIDEFARVLRPNGRVLLNEGRGEWCGMNLDWLDSGVGMQWNNAGAEATRNQLEKAGFTIINEWYVEIPDDGHWVFFSAQLDV